MRAEERATRRWVEEFVVALGLCPFAEREVQARRLRYAVSTAQSAEELLEDLARELQRLQSEPDIETTLLIHPQVLQNFDDYNDFLDYAEALLRALELEGVFQLASFHPDYRFAGTDSDDPGNYTNRSPHPMLHLLREASLERAIAAYPDVDAVPQRNIECMNAHGLARLQALMKQWRD